MQWFPGQKMFNYNKSGGKLLWNRFLGQMPCTRYRWIIVNGVDIRTQFHSQIHHLVWNLNGFQDSQSLCFWSLSAPALASMCAMADNHQRFLASTTTSPSEVKKWIAIIWSDSLLRWDLMSYGFMPPDSGDFPPEPQPKLVPEGWKAELNWANAIEHSYQRNERIRK